VNAFSNAGSRSGPGLLQVLPLMPPIARRVGLVMVGSRCRWC